MSGEHMLIIHSCTYVHVHVHVYFLVYGKIRLVRHASQQSDASH